MIRKYSVAEIGRMRRAVAEAAFHERMVAASDPMIEEWLRTYIINETEPEELEKLAAAWKSKSEAA
jgi:N-acetylglutamate synthase-like GNAT family acetyltransferase